MPEVPARDDYTFVGWNTEKDGSGDWFTNETEVTNSLTVYAIWKENAKEEVKPETPVQPSNPMNPVNPIESMQPSKTSVSTNKHLADTGENMFNYIISVIGSFLVAAALFVRAKSLRKNN